MLPVSYKQRIASVPHVKAISNWQWFGGVYKDARDQRNFFARFVCDPAEILKMAPDMSMPEEQKQAFIHQRTGAIASSSLAEKHGWKLGERITLTGDIFPVTLELKLVGIYKDPEKAAGLPLLMGISAGGPDMPLPAADLVGSFRIIVDAP